MGIIPFAKTNDYRTPNHSHDLSQPPLGRVFTATQEREWIQACAWRYLLCKWYLVFIN